MVIVDGLMDRGQNREFLRPWSDLTVLRGMVKIEDFESLGQN